MFHNPRIPAVLGILGAAALLLGGAGCETKPPDETAKAIYYGEHPVSMRGSDTFFDGQIAAIITISRGIGKGYAGHNTRRVDGTAIANGPEGYELEQTEAEKAQLSSLPSRSASNMAGTSVGPGGNYDPTGQNNGVMPGGLGAPVMPGQAAGVMGQQAGAVMPGQGGPNMGGQGDIDQYGQGTEQDEDAAKMEQENAIAYYRAKAAIGSPLPPVSLHLHLRNLNGKPVTVEVTTFDSDLGNFAVDPGTINLPPHELIQPNPMISQLGVTSDVIPVRVTMRLNGQSETRTILVHSILSASGQEN